MGLGGFMLGLFSRRALLALLLAGCGTETLVPVATTDEALASCNMDMDCSIPGGSGMCVDVKCTSHACTYVMDTGACPTGCGGVLDCTITGSCAAWPCKPMDGTHPHPWCDFNDTTASIICQCTTGSTSGCSAANVCQNAPTCNSGSCTYTAKQPLAQPCCNITSDCGGSATCSTSNICGCTGGNKFCNGASPGMGRCVPSAGCCVPTDCAAGNGCQSRTCSGAGACGYVSNGGAGCCDIVGDCGGTATCMNNTCTCGVGEKFCPGSGPGMGSCIPSTGCCTPSDCAAQANATAACTANVCVYTCNGGFHDCSGTCKSNTSVMSCGTMCTDCPAGNGCQTPSCNGTSCGLTASGPSPCCNSPSDCVGMNACQMATACANNQCVFGKAAMAGCCDHLSDCPMPTDPCLIRTCVANQCATTPVPFCSSDGGAPADMAVADLATPPDLTTTPDDLAAAKLALTGGGGCAVAADAPSPLALPLVVFLAFVALRRPRRE
jgi:MYXO-CTERM domain-containing protein